MNHFNQSASTWDSEEKVKMMQTIASKVINMYPQIFNNSHQYDIMDFGAGTGLFGLEFLPYAKSLTAVDTSPEMLKELNQKNTSVETHCLNLEDQNLDKKFDIIISSMAFHHVEKPKEMIEKFKTMLKENGHIFIVDLSDEDGTFHKDNKAMGVKHHGFHINEILEWAKDSDFQLDFKQINSIEKNDKTYSQFLAVFY